MKKLLVEKDSLHFTGSFAAKQAPCTNSMHLRNVRSSSLTAKNLPSISDNLRFTQHSVLYCEGFVRRSILSYLAKLEDNQSVVGKVETFIHNGY